jgi:16S rRNA (guanine527-N7)-methyltransferase
LPDRRSQREFGEPKEILVAGATALGLQLSAGQIDSFLAYLYLLVQWSARFNLTSIRKPDLMVKRHFLDSVAIWPFITTAGRLLDIGTGAGFPGLPLKIILPDKEVVLVESSRKKANFLRELVRKLNLDRVRIVEKRAEELYPDEAGSFDEVVTRALGSAELFLKLSCPLLVPGGKSLIMHGPKGTELFQRLERQYLQLGFRETRLEKFELPIGHEKRCLLIFLKK